MKHTMYKEEVVEGLLEDREANWSWPAVIALANYYEELERETGREIEFDPAAIRREWNEIGSEELLELYQLTSDQTFEDVLEYLRNRTVLKELHHDNIDAITYLYKRF